MCDFRVLPSPQDSKHTAMNSDIHEVIILRMFTVQSINCSERSVCMVAVSCVVNRSFAKNVDIRIWAPARKKKWKLPC